MHHQSAQILLDPGRALCWEDESTLRIGFDQDVLLVGGLTPRAQRVVARLVTGMPEHEFKILVRQSNAVAKDVHDVLNSIRPALLRMRVPARLPVARASHPESSVQSSIRASIHDDGREVPGLRSALEANWLCTFEPSSADPELAIQVIRFLEPLERAGRWVSAGIPHLLIRFTDEAVRIGPLIDADGAPCHTCEALHLIERDPELAVVAAQFYGKLPSSESVQTSLLASSIAAHYVHAWRDGALWVHDSQLLVPVRRGTVSGLPSLTRIKTHSECGCSLSEESPTQI